MRSLLAPFITLLIASTASTLIYDADDGFVQQFNATLPKDDPRKEGIAAALDVWQKCREFKWSCQKACRAQVPLRGNDSVTYCTTPHPGETCFGIPIDYKYVPSREQLPVEYEVLRRFPKCWSVLGPMLCGMIYRPCGVYEFVTKLKPTKPQKMEVWQRFGIGMCRRVHEQCEDAIKEGFFPSQLIDCQRTAENVTWVMEKTNASGPLARYVPSGNEEELKTEWDRQTVFTEEQCSINYNENASRHEPMQCIFPLVYTMHEKIEPVIDKCFLPCRNPLISSPDKFLSFRVIRALLCAAFAAICLAIFVFLSYRSKIFVESDCIFSIACCLLFFALYLAFWGLGSIAYFAETAECTHTAQGVPIRSTPMFESTWCTISAVVQHVCLLSSIGFLAAAYALSTAGATRAAKREDLKKGEGSSGLRAYLVFSVVLVSVIIGFIALFLRMVTTDGVAGVCSVGLHSITGHLMVVALPGLCFCLIGLGAGAIEVWREKKKCQAEDDHAVEEKIREGIDHEKAKKKIEFWTERGPHQKEEIQDQVRRGSLPPLEERDSEEGAAVAEERDGEEEVLVLRGDEDEERQWLTDARKKEIADAVREERREEWRGREQRAWHETISSRYTLIALCLCMGSLLLGLVVHWVSLANNGREEYATVREYVICVMSKSIIRKDLHWMTEPVHAAEMWLEGTGENDPLVRRHNLASEVSIHSCVYPSTGDGRIFGLLVVFILLPLLPVCVFIWAFAAGFVGLGGMPMVKTRRESQKKMKDLEMTHLTSDRDGDSQMMSSVCSSMGDRSQCAFPPALPSSTVSTVLSSARSSAIYDASGASSTHSSVSIRGRLPRFPSAERLMTVRATSPVPSGARSELVVVPNRRSRSVGHHRVLDMMGRTHEKKERNKRKKTRRASSAQMNARREGVAESGQLMAPRNSVDTDVRSVSSHSSMGGRGGVMRGASSTIASSILEAPSEMGRRMRENAEALMNRARQLSTVGLQQQVQMVQEELLLRSLPRDEQNGENGNNQNGNDNNVNGPDDDVLSWMRMLNEVRDTMQTFVMDPALHPAANDGMMLSGLGIALGRNIRINGLARHPSNYQVLQHALDRLQALALHLTHRLAISPGLTEDIAAVTQALRIQIQINAAPNARQLLNQLFTENLELELHCPMANAIREQIYERGISDERREQLLNQMLDATNRRNVLRLARRLPRYGHRRLSEEEREEQLNRERLAAEDYPPMQVVDLTLPPELEESSVGSQVTRTNSTFNSSALSTTYEEERNWIRTYYEAQQLPPAGAEPAAAEVVAGDNRNPGANEFLQASDDLAMLRANGIAGPPARGAVPSSNNSELASYNDDDEEDDDRPMSSETSNDSTGRQHSVPPYRFGAPGGAFGVPVYPPVRPLPQQQLQPIDAPRAPALFPFVRPEGLPPVPQFPGARPRAPLHATREAQQAAQSAAFRQAFDRLEAAAAPPTEQPTEEGKDKKRKRKAVPPVESDSSCSMSNRRNNDDDQPPPMVGLVRVLGGGEGAANAIAAELEAAGTSGLRQRELQGGEEAASDTDSGIDSLDSLAREGPLRLYVEVGRNGVRPATKEEVEELARKVQKEVEERLQRERGDRAGAAAAADDDDDEAGPSNDESRMQRRARLMNRYLHHSNPDLAMEEERREVDLDRDRDEARRVEEADLEREEEEMRRVREARARQHDGRREARRMRDSDEEDDESISSLLTPEEQAALVRALRAALDSRPTEGMDPDQQRLVEHLRLALDTQGGISRDEIMRFRVMETNRATRDRQDATSPYRVSSVVVSRMSLAEIGVRVDAIRSLSSATLYPLEIYYQLHLADVVWPLNGRDVMLGDNVYTQDEINRVLGTDSPLVPPGADSADFHALMRKRAITAASLTGRAYGRQRGSQGPRYEPPRLPDMGVYRLLGDPLVLVAAIEGDLQPIRDAINRIPLTMPDVMRLDNRSEHTLGSNLRHFRDYLDVRARDAGYELRDDTYIYDDVPQEPTGSRTQQGTQDGEQAPDRAQQQQPDPDADPDF